MRRRTQPGTVLITVLILLTVLFIMGMAMLGMRVTQTRSAVLMKYAMMAKYVAEAGMEDARIKLLKVYDFPPVETGGQTFSYTETLRYPGDADAAGEYKVTVDVARNSPGEYYDGVVFVTSVGIVRDREGKEIATRQINAIFDTAEKDRKDPTARNPNRFKYVEWQDIGNI